MAPNYSETDARRYAARVKGDLLEIKKQLRDDVIRVDDMRAKALFETSAEVISGLCNAFEDFEQGEEPAWK